MKAVHRTGPTHDIPSVTDNLPGTRLLKPVDHSDPCAWLPVALNRGGVVTAEEMAPFLDAPAPRVAREGEDVPYYPDEGWVLPALLKFGGRRRWTRPATSSTPLPACSAAVSW